MSCPFFTDKVALISTNVGYFRIPQITALIQEFQEGNLIDNYGFFFEGTHYWFLSYFCGYCSSATVALGLIVFWEGGLMGQFFFLDKFVYLDLLTNRPLI